VTPLRSGSCSARSEEPLGLELVQVLEHRIGEAGHDPVRVFRPVREIREHDLGPRHWTMRSHAAKPGKEPCIRTASTPSKMSRASPRLSGCPDIELQGHRPGSSPRPHRVRADPRTSVDHRVSRVVHRPLLPDAHAKAAAPDRPRYVDERLDDHVRAHVLPGVQGSTQPRLQGAAELVLRAELELVIDLHLLPGDLVDRDHGPNRPQGIQRLPGRHGLFLFRRAAIAATLFPSSLRSARSPVETDIDPPPHADCITSANRHKRGSDPHYPWRGNSMPAKVTTEWFSLSAACPYRRRQAGAPGPRSRSNE